MNELQQLTNTNRLLAIFAAGLSSDIDKAIIGGMANFFSPIAVAYFKNFNKYSRNELILTRLIITVTCPNDVIFDLLAKEVYMIKPASTNTDHKVFQNLSLMENLILHMFNSRRFKWVCNKINNCFNTNEKKYSYEDTTQELQEIISRLNEKLYVLEVVVFKIFIFSPIDSVGTIRSIKPIVMNLNIFKAYKMLMVRFILAQVIYMTLLTYLPLSYTRAVILKLSEVGISSFRKVLLRSLGRLVHLWKGKFL
jgi:hypothetical protein